MDNRINQDCTALEDLVNYTNIGNSSAIEDGELTSQIIPTLQSIIASVGIVANSTVMFVFLNNEKMRRKIPNIFIINQVRVQSDHLRVALQEF